MNVKKTVIVGLVGRSGSGKDSVVDILKAKTNKNIISFAMADNLKKGCSVLYGIPLDHFYDRKLKESIVPMYNKTPRQICQWMGTDILRNQVSKTFHVDRMKVELDKCIKGGVEYDYIFITDVRFEQEAEMVKDNGGMLFYINADKRLGPLSPTAHESERHIGDIGRRYCSCELKNDGSLQEYETKILNIF